MKKLFPMFILMFLGIVNISSGSRPIQGIVIVKVDQSLLQTYPPALDPVIGWGGVDCNAFQTGIYPLVPSSGRFNNLKMEAIVEFNVPRYVQGQTAFASCTGVYRNIFGGMTPITGAGNFIPQQNPRAALIMAR